MRRDVDEPPEWGSTTSSSVDVRGILGVEDDDEVEDVGVGESLDRGRLARDQARLQKDITYLQRQQARLDRAAQPERRQLELVSRMLGGANTLMESLDPRQNVQRHSTTLGKVVYDALCTGSVAPCGCPTCWRAMLGRRCGSL